ncbi:MAG: hypothetical protein NTV51_03980 [Verrucomicrobia bacterium]|nr:hypothetical protein [Verrucomicrobiota bacterium]
MSDPNAIKWDERRIFTARLDGLALAVWGADGEHFWSVSHWDSAADRSGVERSFIAAKRAAEKCARAWASVDAYCLPGGKEWQP